MVEQQDRGLERVRELIDLMHENDLLELELAEGENRISLKRPGANQAANGSVSMPPAPGPAEAGGDDSRSREKGTTEVKSPLVGVFYSAPSPDADPFVAVGAKVEPDTVIGIVEAMKVMNEIRAECAGTVVAMPAEAGQAVEYGQVLCRVRS